ncbi:MAG: hypothetical protein V7K21_01305 [Nostoc sp.]|uniref:hypothetical protein n=1 Tax=Nostoc sp. TaxID=1180 RepID=UPI002FFD518B
MPNTTLEEAAPTVYLDFATSTPLSTSRYKSLSTSAQCPIHNLHVQTSLQQFHLLAE